MKTTKTILLLVLVHIFCNSETLPQNNLKYLEAAEKTANWLMSIEQQHGVREKTISWPESNIETHNYLGIDNGAAGIGLFFLKLYGITGKSIYLERAEGAADYILEFSSSWWKIDWLNGAAGYGHYFLELYKLTNKNKYLEYSQKAANWLKARILYDKAGNYYWRNPINPNKLYTGFAHGTAGIAMFFVELYEISSDENDLIIAENCFNWVAGHYVRFTDKSIGWKRLTDDDYVYNLWCGGTVGIMFFLEKMYNVTGKEVYKLLLKKSADGLIEKAYRSLEQYAWNYTSTGGPTFPIAYCHGTSSVAHILFNMSNTIGDAKYLEYAKAGMEWLKNAKLIYSEKEFYWPHIYEWNQYDTGLMTGTAGVGYSFVQAYKNDNSEDYLEYAKAAADYLLDVAEESEQGYLKWINYTNYQNSNYASKQYNTGWYNGAAGIGIFLIDLYEALNTVVKIIDHNELHSTYSLEQNYPNPFNPSTKIQYSIPQASEVNLKIFDILGQEVATIIKEFKERGNYTIEFDASYLPSGLYFYRITAGEFINTKKMILTK